MAFLSSIGSFFSHFAAHAAFELSALGGLSGQTALSISEVITEFFKNMFYFPGEYKIPILVIVVVFVALIIGIAFLAKKIYDYYKKYY